MENLKTVQIDNKSVIQTPPFSPSKETVLGTDDFGRDMYTMLVYGTRITMILCLLIVIGRFLVAVPVGISAGFGNLASKAAINQFIIIFSGIPALLIAIRILKMNFFTSMFKTQSIISFIVVLTIVGWPRLGHL